MGDKTIMDTLIPAQEAYQAAVEKGASLPEALAQMSEAAEQGKESTRDLGAKIGRASRLGERSRGVLDAGATSGALILQTFAKTLSATQPVSEAGMAKKEIPIARNANPAGVSTARQVPDVTTTTSEGGSATEAASSSGTDAPKKEIPIARNANPQGID